MATTPTPTPTQYDPVYDAKALRASMDRIGTDEDKLIEILANRSKPHIALINAEYQKLFNTTLAADIKGDTSFNFKRALLALATPGGINEFKATELRRAMKGLGTKESVLIDVMTQTPGADMLQIKYYYAIKYGAKKEKKDKKKKEDKKKELTTSPLYESASIKTAPTGQPLPPNSNWQPGQPLPTWQPGMEYIKNQYIPYNPTQVSNIPHMDALEKAIIGDTSGNFQKTLLELLKGNRTGDHVPVNESEAERDADDIYKHGEGRLGTNDKIFINILTSRNVNHLQAVSKHYQAKHKKTLLQAIDAETSGDYCTILKALAKSRDVYFAERLHKAISGAGTDDSTVIYALTSNEKTLLHQVATKYKELYKEDLKTALIGDTSGDYKKLMLELIK